MSEIKVSLKELYAPSFYSVHKDIKAKGHTHYYLKGGRGSTKSSFIALQVIMGMMGDKNANAVAMRKVKDTLHSSVFEQCVWAIDKLGVTRLWKIPKSKLELTYVTGQKIKFFGADDPQKLKSMAFRKGYCKYVWYEELDEFDGMAEIRNINQTLLRGGQNFVVFYSYNPPKSQISWVNEEAKIIRDDRLVHHSTYLDVPREWLGEQFIREAEHLRDVKEKNYRHEYLGEEVGSGGEVFDNIQLREISDDEIKQFEVKRRGLDFGYAVDPVAYCVMAYNRKYRRLYIYYEFYAVGASNKRLYTEIMQENTENDVVYADSAEPKSINELRQYGLRVAPVKKGADSVEYGIKFLQGLEAIVIDPKRCPEAAREFSQYELERDIYGNLKASFPDKNNNCLDSTRYALNHECLAHREAQPKDVPADVNPQMRFEEEKPKEFFISGKVTEDFFKKGW